jgi:hypothetical protein
MVMVMVMIVMVSVAAPRACPGHRLIEKIDFRHWPKGASYRKESNGYYCQYADGRRGGAPGDVGVRDVGTAPAAPRLRTPPAHTARTVQHPITAAIPAEGGSCAARSTGLGSQQQDGCTARAAAAGCR